MNAGRVSGDFVFRDRGDGQLELVGDFDGLYRTETDPWGQSGNDARMGEYYRYSRANILRVLDTLPRGLSVLEVGCGHGHVTRQIAASGTVARAAGSDISPTAIETAKRLHPEISFYIGDVTATGFVEQVGRFDVVILNQLLWYVLQAMPTLLDNVHAATKPGGWMMFVNAFLQEPQRYGREIVDGFDGLVRYLAAHTEGRFHFVSAALTQGRNLSHDDGFVLMRSVDAS